MAILIRKMMDLLFQNMLRISGFVFMLVTGPRASGILARQTTTEPSP